MNVCRIVCFCFTLFASLPLAAQVSIFWGTGAVNRTNQTSDGQPMGADFRFELGVFAGSFVPTPANTAQWAANWRRAGDREAYVTSSSGVSGDYIVPPNATPFNAGRKTYVWGFSGDPVKGEWILFSAPSWTWPSVTAGPPPPPIFFQWFATAATPVLGEIKTSPFLLKTAAVLNSSPPSTPWAEWQQDALAGEPLNGPNDDPDADGMPNLLEFIFGTSPKLANPPPATPVTIASGHLVISIPRRTDRPAILTVEVSDNLQQWNSGPSFTEVLSNDAAAWVVRDLTPVDAANPSRFIRLKAALPPP